MEYDGKCSGCGEEITTNTRDCLVLKYQDTIVSVTCDACVKASAKMSITVVRDGANVTHYQTFTLEVA
jgi:hypothetical protein